MDAGIFLLDVTEVAKLCFIYICKTFRNTKFFHLIINDFIC